MSAPWRSRILGDLGENGPENWWWGEGRDPNVAFDGLLLLDAATPESLAELRGTVLRSRFPGTATRRFMRCRFASCRAATRLGSTNASRSASSTASRSR